MLNFQKDCESIMFVSPQLSWLNVTDALKPFLSKVVALKIKWQITSLVLVFEPSNTMYKIYIIFDSDLSLATNDIDANRHTFIQLIEQKKTKRQKSLNS